MGKLLPDVHHCCLVTGLPSISVTAYPSLGVAYFQLSYTCGQFASLTQASIDILYMHVFGRGEKAEYQEKNPCTYRKNEQTPHRKTVGQNWTDNLLAMRVQFQPLHHHAIAEPHVHASVICVHPQLSLIFSGCLIRRSHRGDCCCSYHHPNCGVLIGIRPSHLLMIVSIIA